MTLRVSFGCQGARYHASLTCEPLGCVYRSFKVMQMPKCKVVQLSSFGAEVDVDHEKASFLLAFETIGRLETDVPVGRCHPKEHVTWTAVASFGLLHLAYTRLYARRLESRYYSMRAIRLDASFLL